MKEESGHGLGPTRARVLRHLLSSHKAQPISAIASDLGLHPNTIRFHLEALEDRGYVHHINEARMGKGRPRKLFAATAQAPEVDTSHLRDLTQVLIRHVLSNSETPKETAQEIGFHWGQEVAAAEQAEQPEPHPEEAVSEVLAHTRDMGFLATQADEETVAFHSCPYRSMGATDPRKYLRHPLRATARLSRRNRLTSRARKPDPRRRVHREIQSAREKIASIYFLQPFL